MLYALKYRACNDVKRRFVREQKKKKPILSRRAIFRHTCKKSFFGIVARAGKIYR